MYVRVHKAYREIIAICDEELLGKNFEEGTRVLNITEYFFGGDKCDEKEVERIIIDGVKGDSTFQIAGEKSVQISINLGAINEEGVKKIQGIPIALILL